MIKRVIALTAALFLSGLCVRAAGKPNVVVIVSDDAGYADFSMQGSKSFLTPRIDSIAAQGVRFTDAYVSAPVCSPSRAGILTGRYQTRFGHELNITDESSLTQGLPVDQKTFADLMKEGGYRTLAVGKWHLGYAPVFQPKARGFDNFYGFLSGHRHYFPKPDEPDRDRMRQDEDPVEENFGYLTDDLARQAAAYIRKSKDTPFFLYLAFNAVHRPFEALPDDLKNVHGADKKRETLCAMALALDRGVGVVLDELQAQGLTDNTVVFFINDNGGAKGDADQNWTDNSPLRDYKGSGFDGGVRVPFAIRWPDKIPAGRVFNSPVISLDILPTALAAAGIARPDNLDGVNLLPYIGYDTAKSEATGRPHDALFWRWGSVRAARVGDWKMVCGKDKTPMLFDLANDIGEQNDLATQQPEKLKELQDAWTDWNKSNVPPKWTYADKPKNQKAEK